MASNIENDEGHDQENEQGEARPVLSSPRLIEGVRDLLLRWFKEAHLQKAWPQMSEADQKTWINRIEERAEKLVDEVIEHVNHGDFPVVNAKIDSFTVKNGEVKVVTKGFADNDMLAILNSAGEKRVQITVMRNDQFDENRDPLNAEPDQPGLPGVKMHDEPGFENDDRPVPAVEEPEIENPAGESEAGDAVLQPKSDQWRGGFNSRMAGHAKTENPFTSDGGQMMADWSDGWDAGDFDAQAPKLAEVEAPKEKKPRKKAGPKVEPDIEPEVDAQVEEPAVDGEAQLEADVEGGPSVEPGEDITDNEGTVIESDEHAYRYGRWCRADGRGTGSSPFEVASHFGKAWLRGYSDERRDEKTRPAADSAEF
jgi:hypothetical protein